MNFSLTEQQALIEESALRLLSRLDGSPAANRPPGDQCKLWNDIVAMGWLGLPLAEADGGFDGGVLESGLLMRAFGAHPAAAPAAARFHSGVLQAARLIAEAGTQAQKTRWLPGLVSGADRAAMAHEETHQVDPWGPRRTIATPEGDGWRLQGEKAMVMGGLDADVLVVSASLVRAGTAAGMGASADDPPDQAVFLVEPQLGGAGMSCFAARAADGAEAVDLQLDGLWLPAKAMLGTGTGTGAGLALARVIAEGLITLCWEAAGAMRAGLEMTVAYTAQREQFGRTLASFQVVQHRLAEMAVCCEEAVSACELAALRCQSDVRLVQDLASMAKSKVGRAARYVAEQSVQLHGAMGVSEELPVAALFRKLTQFQQQGGNASWHAARLGERLLVNGAWRASQTLLPRPFSVSEPSCHAP